MSAARTQVFVISLAADGERRRTFDRRAAAADAALPYEYFDACTTLLPGLIYSERKAQEHHGRALTPGELGCFSSHFALREKLDDDGEVDQYIVLEDDVIADWHALELLAKHHFALDGHAFIRLFQKRLGKYLVWQKVYVIKQHLLIESLDVVHGTQGYVVTKPGARRLVEACRTVLEPVDHAMERYWRHKIPNLLLYPPIVIEEASASSIGSGRFWPSWKSRFGRPMVLIERVQRELLIRVKQFWHCLAPGHYTSHHTLTAGSRQERRA